MAVRAPSKLPPVVLTFGGGINARRRPFDVELDECVSGENFNLDPQQRAMRSRAPFSKRATVPNARTIKGFAQLIKQDGTISTLVQGGDTVYTWDGVTTFANVGSVNSGAKLRGHLKHNFTLDNIVVITDLTLTENVKQWDGTTFQDFTHNLGTNLKAKFANVRNERLYFGNVTTSSATPQVLLASALGDDNTLTVADRPSSSISLADPFFIPTPDLKPINGLEEAFGQFLISTRNGKMFILVGTSAFDFDLKAFYEGSSASGDEAMVNIGNDVLIGQQGKIESLSGVVSYGDVQTNDVTLHIGPLIEGVMDWNLVYDRLRQSVLCFPDTQAACWTLYKALLNPAIAARAAGQNAISPWSKWTTTHSFAMQPTTVMALKDPVTGGDIVLAGDGIGNIYELNADTDQDGGTDDVVVIRRSKVINVPAASIFDVVINIDYRRQFETDITMRFYWGGVEAMDVSEFTITLSADDSLAVYNGPYYYNGGSYYSSTTTARIRRQQKHPEGRGEFLQIEVQATSSGGIDVQQIEILLAISET